jgi:hypothetical protein
MRGSFGLNVKLIGLLVANKVVDNNNNNVIIANDVANIDAYVTAAVAVSEAYSAVSVAIAIVLVVTTGIAVSVTPAWHSACDVRRTNQDADGGNHQPHDQFGRHRFVL